MAISEDTIRREYDRWLVIEGQEEDDESQASESGRRRTSPVVSPHRQL